MPKIIKIVLSILSLSLGYSSVTPVEFEYNQSTEQAFYFIIDASIDGIPIEEGDWVAAFKGDLCVGSRQWIGSYTDIPVMGDDGEEYSVGYMLPGEYPTFKVYKLSDSNIFNAHPSENVGFPQGLLAFFEIQSLDVVYDCADVLGGYSVIDNCDICDDDPSNDCANDCMGLWGGDAFIDDCGVCSDGTSGHEPNSDKDDCGVCFGSGENEQGCGCFLPPAEEYWFDEDGDGFGSGEFQVYCYADLPTYWVDNDADPEPNCPNPDSGTLMIDHCGICGGGGTDDLGCGCFISAPVEYWYDSDGDGLGSGDSEYYCGDDIPENWLTNNEDLEPDCSTNNTDNCGVCDGHDYNDLGCGCYLPAALEYWYDVDGDGFGFGESEEYCIQDTPENWVTNHVDLEEFCWNPDPVTPMIDDCDVCGGGDSDDLGCGCFNPASLEYWYDADGDGLGSGDSEEFCLQNIPDNWVLNNNDTEPYCSTNDIDHCGVCGGGGSDDLGCGCFNPTALEYWYDADGDNLGFGDSIEFCLDDLLENWVTNNEDLEPNCETNNTDQCGVCSGGGSDELGCGCFNPAALEYWYDSDGDGLGSGDSEYYCLDDLLENWVTNNEDLEPNCETNNTDQCGVCYGDNSTCADCNDEPYGLAFLDACNNCVEGSTGLEENYADQGCGCYIPVAMIYCEDTDGDDFGNPGTESEFCIADVPNDWVLNCSDPEPECSTNDIDHCGVCGGGGSDELGCGCFNPAALEYWYDADGDNLGFGDSMEFCLDDLLENWVLNGDDEYPNCSDNFYDDCDICGGDGSDDLGCGCFEPAALIYCEDSDIDGYGSPNTETEFCLNDIPENWIIDCSDPYPNCDGEVDYCGVCNGNGSDDIGCGCFEAAPIQYCYDADGDELGAGSFIYFCAADVLDSWVPDCSDLEPFCETNDTDDCDVCGGDNSSCYGCTDESAWNYCIDCTIEDGTCIFTPEEFNYSQSTAQAFYFVIGADILDVTLNENEDWIGVFNGDVCVGSRPWEGSHTSAPAMGVDGSEWTTGYLQNGDYPTFKIFDASENTYFETEAINIYLQDQLSFSEYNGWEELEIYEIERLRARVPDCVNVLDGDAYIDECGECVGGTTNIEESWVKDCNGDCFGEAYIDSCGVCSEGNSGHSSNADNLGCGCFDLAPEDYWYDIDGDGLGSGESVSLCLDDVSEVWVQNGDDLNPFCSTNDTDECGVCAGNNNDMDCAGICGGSLVNDECGVCDGDNSFCTGCMDDTACNYSLTATISGECEYSEANYDCSGNCNLTVDCAGICGGSLVNDECGVCDGDNSSCTGCMDDTACNYSLTATISGECEYAVEGYDCNGNCNGDNSSCSDCAGVPNGSSLLDDCGVCGGDGTSCLAPVANAQSIELLEDMPTEIILFGYDQNDYPIIEYTIITSPLNGSLTGELPTVLYTPNINFNGEDNFQFTVSTNQFTSEPATIYLTVLPVNDSPQIVSNAIIEATEDLAYEYQIQVVDSDNDSFYFSLISAPEGMQISENGLITWLPTEGIMSSGLVTIVVWDTNSPISGIDQPALQQFIIDVESINDAPVITSTPVISATEDEEYSYQVTASDIDSYHNSGNWCWDWSCFTYSLAVAPEGMTISNEGLIEWIPTEGILSSDMVQVNVSDNDNVNPIISSQQFLVVVTPINDAPIILSIAGSSATIGEEYTYQVVVEDPDDDEFTYILFNNPDEMHVDEMGLVSWIPVLPGIYGPITLAVSDGGENYIQPVQELFIVMAEVASPFITMEFELLHQTNLISFLGIPEDSSVTDIFEPLGNNAQALIGQGVASNNLGNGNWVGSLYNIEPTSGYWLKVNFPPTEPFVLEAYPTNPNQNYELIEGQNIISYVGSDGMAISEAIPDEYENSFYGIIGQGSATVQLIEGGWVGSLNQFNNLKGYWVQVDEDMDFNWNITEGLVRESLPPVNIQKHIPVEFIYAQSTQQAFYFVENAHVDEYDLLEDDWLLAYHDNTVIGARQWDGQFTDIPAMGIDGFDDTFGYIESGMIPEFKLFRESTGELIEMTGEEIAPWRNNEMTFISLTRKEEIPASVTLNHAFPNPFNPSTQISFDIVHEGFINLSIYDIKGRLVEVLKNDVISEGSHSLIWNAQSYASGIYFVHLITDNMSLSQKLVLVK